MAVLEYEQKLTSLVEFVVDMNLFEATNATKFENYLKPRISGIINVQILRTLHDVMDATWIAQKDKLEAQRHKEKQYHMRAEEKRKGKKFFVQEKGNLQGGND